MIRFSHFAAPAVVAAGLLVGAGCANHDRPDEVPGSADTVATGTKDVKTTAAHDGTVYIYDETAHKMVYTGKVERGDRVEVDAHHNRVKFNDKTAVERDLIDDHHYQIYFDKDPHANDTTYLRDGTVIHENDGKTTIVAPRSDASRYSQPAPAPSGQTVIVQPQAQPAAGSITVQPQTPPPPAPAVTVQPQGSSSSVTVQPSATPAPSNSQTVYPSNNGATVVQPAPGQTTVVQPSR